MSVVEPAAPAPTARSAMIVGLLGIGSLPGMLFCGLGAIPAVVALFLAPGAHREVLGSGGRFAGLGIIRAARICSWVSLALAVLEIIALIFAYRWLMAWAAHHHHG